MATVTLVANTDYSALSLANDDTIVLAGFTLTLDIQPTHTGIQVTSPGTAGTVAFGDAWVIPTWDFYSGMASIINTLPEGASIHSVTGGTGGNARGVFSNYGSIASVAGGAGSNCHGVNVNYGSIGTATAGPSNNTVGVSTNIGHIATSQGGTTSNAIGTGTNNGLVTTAVGGSASAARGVSINRGTVVTAIGGSDPDAPGVNTNDGQCLRLTDETAPAVSSWSGETCFVEGPYVNGVIPDSIKTIYSLGELSGGATIAGDATVIEMELAGGGGGSPPPRIRQGNLIGRSF